MFLAPPTLHGGPSYLHIMVSPPAPCYCHSQSWQAWLGALPIEALNERNNKPSFNASPPATNRQIAYASLPLHRRPARAAERTSLLFAVAVTVRPGLARGFSPPMSARKKKGASAQGLVPTIPHRTNVVSTKRAPGKNVISTGATDGIIVRRAAERSLYLPLPFTNPTATEPAGPWLFLSSPKTPPKQEIPNKDAPLNIFKTCHIGSRHPARIEIYKEKRITVAAGRAIPAYNSFRMKILAITPFE
jgi:hypothetical protein